MWPKCLFLGDQFQPSWNGWETGCKPISWPNLTAFLSLLNTHTHTRAAKRMSLFSVKFHIRWNCFCMKLNIQTVWEHHFIHQTRTKNLSIWDHMWLSKPMLFVSPNILYKVHKQKAKLFQRSICYSHKDTTLPRNCYMPLL